MLSAGEMFADWIERRFDGNQRKAAESLKISPAYVSYFKSNERAPGRDLAIRLQALTGIPVTAWTSTAVAKSTKKARKPRRNTKPSQGVNANA